METGLERGVGGSCKISEEGIVQGFMMGDGGLDRVVKWKLWEVARFEF